MDRERAEEQIQMIRDYNEALRAERDKLRTEVAVFYKVELEALAQRLRRSEDMWCNVSACFADMGERPLVDVVRETVSERDTLRAEAARLREALEEAHEGAARQLAEPRNHADDQYALTAIATTCENGLASTPATAEWLAERDAEQRRIGAAEWLEKAAAENHERFGTHFFESTTDSFLAEAAALRAGKGE